MKQVVIYGEYTPEERGKILERMRSISDDFYYAATVCGCHAFIEFAGLMNEFIDVCNRAETSGNGGWVHANGHGENLAMLPHEVAYVREKLNCIYGNAVLAP